MLLRGPYLHWGQLDEMQAIECQELIPWTLAAAILNTATGRMGFTLALRVLSKFFVICLFLTLENLELSFKKT